MIPLSNGRSPRIDQFYATLRTYKSHQFHEETHGRSDEQKSIQHIRSLGKQILDDEPSLRKIHTRRDHAKSLYKSTQLLLKPSNLYDKYKEQAGKKISKEIVRTKQIIIKQQINRTPEKGKTDKKYDNVPSKLQQKSTVKGLNYAKKVDLEAEKMRKMKNQTQRTDKEIKEKQFYFQKNGKTVKNTTNKQATLSGLLKRADELQARKQKCIERIRTQQLEKEISHLTFQPQMISRKLPAVEQSFQRRTWLASTQKLSNQKFIIKQTLQPYSFTPQTNTYKNVGVDSKVSKIWQSERRKLDPQKVNSFDNGNASLQQTKLGEHSSFKSQNTATTAHINLKNMNELSFIFE